MKIYRAIKSNWLTQKFGKENTAKDMMSMYSSLGMKGHNGWDWACYKGEPIYFPVELEGVIQEGKVFRIVDDPTRGTGIYITTEDKDGRFIHVFWHMLHNGIRKGLKVGDTVKFGDLLGYGDSSGQYTTGHHLHEGASPCNKLNNKTQLGNGYNGAIDLEPYYNLNYVMDIVTIRKKIEIMLKQLDIYRLLMWLVKQRSKIK